MKLTEIEIMVQELHQNCIGGWIQKIHQPFQNTLTMDVRIQGESLNLLICAEPQFARLHLASKKYKNPPTPPPFCKLLRAHLEAGRIEEVAQEPSDRVVYFTLTTGVGRYILVIALTGKQSNVYLLKDSKKIIQALRTTGEKPGNTYTPPNRNKLPSTPSPSPLPQGGEGEESGHGRTSPSHLSPELSPHRGEKKNGKENSAKFAGRFPVSAEIEERYWKEEQDYIYAQVRNANLSRIRKALKQANKKIKGLQEDLKKAERYREYGRYGELLKSQLHAFTTGQGSVTVVDYFDPALPPLILPLDPSKDPVWNMEDYFKKHHKFLSAEKHLQPRLKLATQEALRLQNELTQLESGDEPPINDILKFQEKRKKGTMSPVQQKETPQPRAKEYRQFVSFDGLPLLVGKTAKDNDTLTFKVAGPDDLWLHARGTPGSHVVVRFEKGAQVPHETLKDAATLALWFSDLKKSGKGEVIYTFRKFVKKAKGQKAGTVTVSREKSIWIEVKKDRVERLKGRIK